MVRFVREPSRGVAGGPGRLVAMLLLEVALLFLICLGRQPDCGIA